MINDRRKWPTYFWRQSVLFFDRPCLNRTGLSQEKTSKITVLRHDWYLEIGIVLTLVNYEIITLIISPGEKRKKSCLCTSAFHYNTITWPFSLLKYWLSQHEIILPQGKYWLILTLLVVSKNVEFYNRKTYNRKF